jgi:hypothetical protein
MPLAPQQYLYRYHMRIRYHCGYKLVSYGFFSFYLGERNRLGQHCTCHRWMRGSRSLRRKRKRILNRTVLGIKHYRDRLLLHRQHSSRGTKFDIVFHRQCPKSGPREKTQAQVPFQLFIALPHCTVFFHSPYRCPCFVGELLGFNFFLVMKKK